MRLALPMLLAACAPEASSDDLPRGFLELGFPVDDRTLIHQVVGVDHDPVDQDSVLGRAVCTSYAGLPFPYCYDGHDGSDFMLDGGFATMDAGSPAVLAAADGVVVSVEDGHYDRCHAAGDGIDCDGNDGIANHVIVRHAFGLRTMYWHLQQGSVAVQVGDAVRCGDELGRIGSSGYSSAPHLHLELQDADGTVIDPFAGEHSQPQTWWAEQGSEVDDLPGPGCTGA